MRRIPRWSDLRPYLQLAPVRGSRVDRRLASAADVADLRAQARRHTPRAVFDYVDGGAGDEVSLHRNRAAFEAIEFVPAVLRDVSMASTATTILGRPSSMPLAFGPTGFTRLMHHEGERAVARAAQRAGIPYALSTVGTTSPEDLIAAVPGGDNWFQLYSWRDRAVSRELVARVRAAGYSTLVLTVDTPVGGARLRDVRSGFTIPPALRPRTVVDIAMHPGWWFNLLTTEPLKFATPPGFQGTVAELVDQMFNPALTLDDVDWLRAEWPRSLVVKGIQTASDARAVVDRGVDGVIVSKSWRPPARSSADTARAAAVDPGGRRRQGRSPHGRRGPKRGGRNRGGRTGRAGMPGRPRVPVRAHGGRRARRRSGCRAAAAGHGPHDEAARRVDHRGPDARARANAQARAMMVPRARGSRLACAMDRICVIRTMR